MGKRHKAKNLSHHLLLSGSSARDFQKWISDTLGDTELAKRISLIELTLPVEDLRKNLLAIMQTRITALKMELLNHMRHSRS